MVALNTDVLGLLDLDESANEREVNQKLICFYAAQGFPAEDIAKKVSVSETVVDVVLTSTEGASQVIRLQNTLYPNTKDRVGRIANLALDKQIRLLLNSTDDKLVYAVSEKLLDRAMGRAVQTVETKNLNLNVDVTQIDKQIEAQMDRIKSLESMSERLKKSNEDSISV
jgi:hypothetical protein